MTDLRLERLDQGVRLSSGGHLVERITMDATVDTGVVLEGGELDLRYGEFRGLTRAVRIVGPTAWASIEHALVVGNGTGVGIANESFSASLALRHSTVVGWSTAVASAGPATIDQTIVWGNQTGVEGVSCTDVRWSDVQGFDCGSTNRSEDPRFVDPASGDYRLRAGSPLLDHGPDPRGYTGRPCLDLDGRQRLLDHDGDGMAQVDPGAYERGDATAAVNEVTGLSWDGPTALSWDAHPAAVRYHVYRGLLSRLGYSELGTCENDLESTGGDAMLIDVSVPRPEVGSTTRSRSRTRRAKSTAWARAPAPSEATSVPCP